MNMMYKLISHKSSDYKFIYFYQIDGDIEFTYNLPYNKPYIPIKNDIISFNTNINPYYTYNTTYNYMPVNIGNIGIMIMNVKKKL